MDKTTSQGGNTVRQETVGTDSREKEKEEGHKPTLLDPEECLTDEECTTDEDDDAEEMFPVDNVDENDADEGQSTDTGQDVLPFAGFANAATGVQLPAPSTEALEHAKKVLGFTPEAPVTIGDENATAPPLPQYPPQEVCFRRASNGEKWFC